LAWFDQKLSPKRFPGAERLKPIAHGEIQSMNPTDAQGAFLEPPALSKQRKDRRYRPVMLIPVALPEVTRRDGDARLPYLNLLDLRRYFGFVGLGPREAEVELAGVHLGEQIASTGELF
jgi:hypothetical protein